MYFLLWLNQLYLREYKTFKRILNQRRYGLQGEEFVKVVDNTYNEIITWRKNLSKLPSGKAPNNNIDSQAIALKLFIVLPSLNAAFYNISHIQLKPSQFPEKKFWRFWNDPLCRNNSGSTPLLNVAVHWKIATPKLCPETVSDTCKQH